MYLSGAEDAAQLAIYHRGKLVVDVASGFKTLNRTVPLATSDLAHVFSVGKVLESLVVAMLVDQGKLELSEPIARNVWPAFAANGKENITVRDLMQHRAGLASLDGGGFDLRALSTRLGTREFDDVLARTRPSTATNVTGYHALSRGLFLDAIVRRVSRFDLLEFIAREVLLTLDEALDGDEAEARASNAPRCEVYLGDVSLGDRVGEHSAVPTWYALLVVMPQLLLPEALTRLVYRDQLSRMLPHERRVARKVFGEVLGLSAETPTSRAFKMTLDGKRILVRCVRALARSHTQHTSDTVGRGNENAAVSREQNDVGSGGVERALARSHCIRTIAWCVRVRAAQACDGPHTAGGGKLLVSSEYQAAIRTDERAAFDEHLELHVRYTDVGWSRDTYRAGWIGWWGVGGASLFWNNDLRMSIAYVPVSIDVFDGWRA